MTSRKTLSEKRGIVKRVKQAVGSTFGPDKDRIMDERKIAVVADRMEDQYVFFLKNYATRDQKLQKVIEQNKDKLVLVPNVWLEFLDRGEINKGKKIGIPEEAAEETLTRNGVKPNQKRPLLLDNEEASKFMENAIRTLIDLNVIAVTDPNTKESEADIKAELGVTNDPNRYAEHLARNFIRWAKSAGLSESLVLERAVAQTDIRRWLSKTFDGLTDTTLDMMAKDKLLKPLDASKKNEVVRRMKKIVQWMIRNFVIDTTNNNIVRDDEDSLQALNAEISALKQKIENLKSKGNAQQSEVLQKFIDNIERSIKTLGPQATLARYSEQFSKTNDDPVKFDPKTGSIVDTEPKKKSTENQNDRDNELYQKWDEFTEEHNVNESEANELYDWMASTLGPHAANKAFEEAGLARAAKAVQYDIWKKDHHKIEQWFKKKSMTPPDVNTAADYKIFNRLKNSGKISFKGKEMQLHENTNIYLDNMLLEGFFIDLDYYTKIHLSETILSPEKVKEVLRHAERIVKKQEIERMHQVMQDRSIDQLTGRKAVKLLYHLGFDKPEIVSIIKKLSFTNDDTPLDSETVSELESIIVKRRLNRV